MEINNHRVRFGLFFVAAATVASAGNVLAESAEIAGDPSKLDEIIVNATRMEKRIDQVPAAISVITKQDIQLGRQQVGLDESLAAIPGLFMQDRYNFAQDLRIAIRGFGARSNFGIRGVKILVDGIPESLPDGQGQSDGIDLGSIEQIEVIRGPSSSLYGNASGGVINITSERGPAEPFVEARLPSGEIQVSLPRRRRRRFSLSQIDSAWIVCDRLVSGIENYAEFRFVVNCKNETSIN